MDHTRFVVRRSRILNTGARYSAVREKGYALKLAYQPAISFSPKIDCNTEKGGHLCSDERFRKTAETRRQRALRPDRSRLQMMSLDSTRRSCLSSGIGIGSGLRPRKRLRQSAAFRNRSSGLRRIIFIHLCSPWRHEGPCAFNVKILDCRYRSPALLQYSLLSPALPKPLS